VAAKEMYDYLSTISSTVDQTLSLKAQGELTERASFKQKIHRGDDRSREGVNLGITSPDFQVTFDFNLLTESDMGTLYDLYVDSAKAFGMMNSFKWSRRQDGHTYVVHFAMEYIARNGRLQSAMGSRGIVLDVIGRISD
jgi:hypothetical protein